MTATALFIHVPVDKVEICNGPGRTLWDEAIDVTRARQLSADPDIWAELEFTLKTTASKVSFRRKIKLVMIDTRRTFGGGNSFTALINDEVVSGYYDPVTRTGWFSLG